MFVMEKFYPLLCIYVYYNSRYCKAKFLCRWLNKHVDLHSISRPSSLFLGKESPDNKGRYTG